MPWSICRVNCLLPLCLGCAGVPKLMHYGLQFTVDDYQFDKHWHYQFDVAKCAPWDMTGVKDRKGGLFPHPPRPSTLSQKVGSTSGGQVC